MYELKLQPEDFVVNECMEHSLSDSGKYLVCRMKKRNYTTEDAIQAIVKILKIPRKSVGYAGNKDRNAMTTQYLSMLGVTKGRIAKLVMKDIWLEPLGYAAQPISLGDLAGNSFEVTVRNLESGFKPSVKNLIPNYFGEQRFSKSNVEIGKAILTKDFKNAANMIILHEGRYGAFAKQWLDAHPNDFMNTIRKIPRKIVMMYLHAYQSMLWNETVKKLLSIGEEIDEDATVPIIGFNTEISDPVVQGITEDIMKREGITFRDFIIREMPELSFEGNERRVYMELKELEIGKPEDDELNPGKKKVLVKFSLGKGSYATVVIEQMFKD